MDNTICIGIEKYGTEVQIPYNGNMTLEQFHKALEKAVGPCTLNICNFENKKNKKLSDVFKGDNYIYLLKNDNLGNTIKYWKGNFINHKNSCYKDSFVQSIVHSMAETIFKKEEELRKKNGLSTAKNFAEYNNSNNDSLWKDLLDVLDKINNKVKHNDSSPLLNFYDPSNSAEDQTYNRGENYMPDNLANLSNLSTSTGSGLSGGSLTVQILHGFNTPKVCYAKDHEIYLKKKTVVSDCINIDVRTFSKCLKCYSSDISVINIGNITIPMYDFLNSYQNKSFNQILKYYYKINNFGNENIKKNEYCKKCKTYNLEYYNKMSTLPDILVIDFNLHSYYNNTPEYKLKEESFYWVLEENISLEEHYDMIYYDYSNKNNCNYELTSFIGHYGNLENGHFINFSKIDGDWFLFDDLSKEEAIKIGDFKIVQKLIEIQKFGFKYKGKEISAKLKICNCFYEKNILKDYDYYIKRYKDIINKK